MSTAFERDTVWWDKKSPAEQTCRKLGMVQGDPCQTKRAHVASPQAHSGHLETDPERAREKTTPSLPLGWGLESTVNGCSETYTSAIFSAHPEQARREDPAKGAGAETAETAADTTRRGASCRLGSKMLACGCQACC